MHWRHSLGTLLLLLLSQAILPAQRQFGFDNRKPSGQEYLSPQETVKRFKVPKEFEIKLFAGEPDLSNPIAFTLDEKGRLWVVESFEYPSRTPAGKAPRDRIVILEDTNNDGKSDKRTVFAEGKDFPIAEERKKAGLGAFDMASGIEVGQGGVYLGAPPYLWHIEIKNDKPGKFTRLLSGFGSQDTHETLNTFQWGPEGWLYGLHGVFTQSNVKNESASGTPEVTRMNAAVWRFHPITKKFEIFAEGTSNPWGLDWRNSDGEFILACCVIPHLYHIVPGGIYKRQAGASFNPYAYGSIPEICDHTFHQESGWAHAGLLSLDVPHIPEKYRHSVIFGSIHGCSIKQNRLSPKGSSFLAQRGEDFLVSGDKNFRPINMKWGPHGDIYLSDWHDQNPCHQAKPDSWDYQRGRIYRLQLKERPSGKVEDLTKLNTVELLQCLIQDQDPWKQRTALRLLTEKHEYRLLKDPTSKKEFLETLKKLRDKDFRRYFLACQATKVRLREGPQFTSEQYRIDEIQSAISYLDARKENVNYLSYTETQLKKFLSKDYYRTATLRRHLASACVIMAGTKDVTKLIHQLLMHKEDATDPLVPYLTWLAYEQRLAQYLSEPAKLDAELSWLQNQASNNEFISAFILPRVMKRLATTGKTEILDKCLRFILEAKNSTAQYKALEGLTEELRNKQLNPPESWERAQAILAQAQNQKIVALVGQLAISFRDPKALKQALQDAGAQDLPEERRLQAIQALATLKPAEAAELLVRLIQKDPRESVRLEAARALNAFPEDRWASAILVSWKLYPALLRRELINTLSSRKNWATMLLRSLQEKKIDPRDVSDNVIIRMQSFKDAALDQLIEKAWGRTRKTPKELDQVLKTMREELHRGTASFRRGQQVFATHCAKCHRFEGKGESVGPELDGAARDVEYLLGNIIDPNRVIGAPYFQRIVRTLDGKVEQGLLVNEDKRFISLKVENGITKTFSRADLEGPVKVVELSMMPEGLLKGMSTQDFRDLIRYLMIHPAPPEIQWNEQRVQSNVYGAFTLPESRTKPATVKLSFNVARNFKTTLEIHHENVSSILLDNKKLTFAPQKNQPGFLSIPVELSQGAHELQLLLRAVPRTSVLSLRLLDPARLLTYPETQK